MEELTRILTQIADDVSPAAEIPPEVRAKAGRRASRTLALLGVLALVVTLVSVQLVGPFDRVSHPATSSHRQASPTRVPYTASGFVPPFRYRAPTGWMPVPSSVRSIRIGSGDTAIWVAREPEVTTGRCSTAADATAQPATVPAFVRWIESAPALTVSQGVTADVGQFSGVRFAVRAARAAGEGCPAGVPLFAVPRWSEVADSWALPARGRAIVYAISRRPGAALVVIVVPVPPDAPGDWSAAQPVVQSIRFLRTS